MAHSLLLIGVMAGVTILLRFLPFFLFRKGAPLWLTRLGELLPCAVMAMLVVYCLKDIDFTTAPHGLREAAAVAVVIVLHKWKHNTLLSIAAGTAVYMVLLNVL